MGSINVGSFPYFFPLPTPYIEIARANRLQIRDTFHLKRKFLSERNKSKKKNRVCWPRSQLPTTLVQGA